MLRSCSCSVLCSRSQRCLGNAGSQSPRPCSKQPAWSEGYSQESVHCPRPQAGYPSQTPSSGGPRGELVAGTSYPPSPSWCHILFCRWHSRPPVPSPFLPALPHSASLPRTLPDLGFFYKFGEGVPQGGDPNNKEIESHLGLRRVGLCFLTKVSCPTPRTDTHLLPPFCSLHPSLPRSVVTCLILSHLISATRVGVEAFKCGL